MKPMFRHALLVVALLLVAGCSNKPAADPQDAPAESDAVEAPGSSSSLGSFDNSDEPYPGAQPADGRSPVIAYPEPDGAEDAEDSADEAEDDVTGDASEEEADDSTEAEDENASEETSDEEASAAAAGAAKMSLNETYSSTDYGYSIDHPLGWLADDSGPVVILSSEDNSDQHGRGGVPANMTKIDIVQLEGFPLDIETRASQIREELDEVVEERNFELMNGEAATWLRGNGGTAGDTGIVVTIVGGQLYQLQAFGNPSPLQAIAYTFRESE